ncbi:TetR/AcrR family transcriptional regulator [Arthrobacter sp. ISL-28]|nr:TetR/AcrR family transcriptional regulator [Arthrobacter sp. ISL-28]
MRTRNDLIESALAAIARAGAEDLAAVTVDRILSEGGMARATLYSHFPGGREELLAAAYQQVAHQFLDHAREYAGSRGIAGENWTLRIQAYAEALLELAGDPGPGYFYNVSGPQLLGFSKERGIGSSGVFSAFRAELELGAGQGQIPVESVEPLAVLLAGSLRDAGIETALHPEKAGQLLSSFRFLVGRLAGCPVTT